MREKKCIYIIARISKDQHAWTDLVCSALFKEFNVFIPKDSNPWNISHKKLSQKIFNTDLKAMKKSSAALMLPEYGRDCAWEAGWYAGSGKPVIVYIDDQIEWLRDWMVKGGINFVLTFNPTTFNQLKKDPILKHKKIIFLDYQEMLGATVKKILQ